MASEEPEILVKDNFDVYTLRDTLCNIRQNSIESSSSSPSILIRELEENDDSDCDRILDVSYYTFKEDLFDCQDTDKSDNPKSILGLKIEE